MSCFLPRRILRRHGHCPVCSGCWLADPLNNWFGRRGTIFISALILIATPIASGFTHNWQALFIVRLVLGIGMGMKGEVTTRAKLRHLPECYTALLRFYGAHICRRKFSCPDTGSVGNGVAALGELKIPSMLEFHYMADLFARLLSESFSDLQQTSLSRTLVKLPGVCNLGRRSFRQSLWQLASSSALVSSTRSVT